MSENNCIEEKDKFESLKCLIKEYYCLVQKNHDGLPPYATFEYVAKENHECDTGRKCNRVEKIKELIGKLKDENTKLNAILQLWATGFDIEIDGKNYRFDKLIHSISNKSRLQVCIKKEQFNSNGLKEFASAIHGYISSFDNKEVNLEHNLLDNSDFKDLLNNNIDAAINELLFWYYYDEDKFPIVNSRAKNSRKILSKTLEDIKSNDLEFHEQCMKIDDFNAIKQDNSKEIFISKQLMLDQLFYSIDEMKSMKKADEVYKDKKDDEIYKFYQKLWNTIKEAKANSKLQTYYKDFLEANYNKRWKENLQKNSESLHKLQQDLKENPEKGLEKILEDFQFKGISDFLNFYLFKKFNGIAGIGNGFASDDHKKKIKNKLTANENELLLTILKSEDIERVNDIFDGINKYKVIKNRFLAVLFSEEMTTIANEDNFNTLIKNLNKKLGIKLESEGYILQNNELMGFYLKNGNEEENDVYNKQIFYWWLFEKLNDNLDLKKAIVYYGAPGTGKTYKAKKVAKQFIQNWHIQNGLNLSINDNLIETVQFHPSFSYEDFVEGIRPSINNTLELKDGSFKKFCKEAGKVEIDLWKNEKFKEKFKDKPDFSKISVSDILDLNNNDINKILSINTDDKEKYKDLKLLDIIPPAFFIIDEINRADLSRVFGELMYSMEYRGYEGKITTQYSYLVNEEQCDSTFFWEDGKNYFFIPQNIYIIGTMNTIDRSVDSFDFALRRRFSWEEVEPNYEIIEELLDPKIAEGIKNALKNLNKKINDEPLLGSDYQIGHAYALNLRNQGITKLKDAKDFLWKNFIGPLLQEYFRGLGDSENKINDLKDKFYS